MKDIYNDNYYRIYDNSIKVEGKLENFALLTFYDKEANSYTYKEVLLKNTTLLDLINGKTSDMVSVVMYSRGIGLIDDFEVYGKPVNVGRTIYFGKIISVAEYNSVNQTPLLLSLDRQVCMLDCGEILTEIDPLSDSSYNVLERLGEQSYSRHRL